MTNLDARRDEVEARFRALLTDGDLPEPDEVEHHETHLVFLWHGPKVAFVVELDDREMEDLDDLEQAMIRGVPPERWPAVGSG
jgi:hypothetical protein